MTHKETFADSTLGYTITVTGRHVQVTDAMKAYATEKISKIERFSNRIIEATVTMDITKLDHRVDIVLKVSNWKIKSSAVTDSMYASIDQAVHRLERQLHRYKSRIQDHHAKGIKDVEMNVNIVRKPTATEEDIVNEEIEIENRLRQEEIYRQHEVVRTATKPLKTLTTEEAVAKMELSFDHFLLFRHEGDRKLRLIYRMKDGDYGIIEPEL